MSTDNLIKYNEFGQILFNVELKKWGYSNRYTAELHNITINHAVFIVNDDTGTQIERIQYYDIRITVDRPIYTKEPLDKLFRAKPRSFYEYFRDFDIVEFVRYRKNAGISFIEVKNDKPRGCGLTVSRDLKLTFNTGVDLGTECPNTTRWSQLNAEYQDYIKNYLKYPQVLEAMKVLIGP